MLTIKQFYLLKLMEECSEVAQRASKQIQFGHEPTDPNTSQEYDNLKLLRSEVNDLLAVLDKLMDLGELPEISPEELLYAKHRKLCKIKSYLEHSQQLGFVQTVFRDGTEHLLKAYPPACALHGRKWICHRDAQRFFPYCAMCTGEETKEGAEERQRLGRNKICGCREYPEYGDACLSEPNHRGPHDWQKKWELYR